MLYSCRRVIMVMLLSLVALPAVADGLDDSWKVCQMHRLLPSPRPRPPFEAGFERCVDVEKKMQPRIDAAQEASNKLAKKQFEEEMNKATTDHTAVLDWVFPVKGK